MRKPQKTHINRRPWKLCIATDFNHQKFILEACVGLFNKVQLKGDIKPNLLNTVSTNLYDRIRDRRSGSKNVGTSVHYYSHVLCVVGKKNVNTFCVF